MSESRRSFDLDQLKRQAKELLRAFRADDAEATETVAKHFPNVDPKRFRLAQAQLVIARANGLRSWARLREAAGVARPRRSQPPLMRTTHYQCDVEAVDGNRAWEFFEVCRDGDLARATELLEEDPHLVNAQHWYQSPIHFAVRSGDDAITRLLLERGAEPGRSRFMYDSWSKLLAIASERGHTCCHDLLTGALRARFGHDPAFADLRAAIVSRDTARVDAVLAASPQLALCSDSYGNGVIHWAAMTRQLERLDRFASLGANLDAVRADGQTPAHVVLNGDYRFRAERELRGLEVPSPAEVVRKLLTLGAANDLSIACAFGDLRRVQELLDADPDAARSLDSGRRSPLMYASRAGHLQIVRELLARGADPNRPEELAPNGHALFSAAQHGHHEVARTLLEHGADPNAGSDSSGFCVTIAAYGSRDQEMIELLRRHGAITPVCDLDADAMITALVNRDTVVDDPEFVSEALARNDTRLVETLADARPDLFASIDGGMLRCGDPSVTITDRSVLARMLELGWTPNQPDWLGKTALHHYAEYGNTDNLLLLIEHGADLDALDDEYAGTPLAWAARCGHTGAVELLLRLGANPELPNDRPWAQPLSRAEQSGHAEAAAAIRAARRASTRSPDPHGT